MITKAALAILVILALAASGPVIAALGAPKHPSPGSPSANGTVTQGDASGRAARIDQLRETIQAATMSYTGHPPFSGTGYDAGRVFGRHGLGAVLQTVTFPHPKTCRPAQCDFNATFEVLYPGGAFYGKISGFDSLNSDGSTGTEGTGVILSGTGRYRAAHGSFKFRGGAPKNGYVDTLKLCGSAKY